MEMEERVGSGEGAGRGERRTETGCCGSCEKGTNAKGKSAVVVAVVAIVAVAKTTRTQRVEIEGRERRRRRRQSEEGEGGAFGLTWLWQGSCMRVCVGSLLGTGTWIFFF